MPLSKKEYDILQNDFYKLKKKYNKIFNVKDEWRPAKSETITEIGIMPNGEIIER